MDAEPHSSRGDDTPISKPPLRAESKSLGNSFVCAQIAFGAVRLSIHAGAMPQSSAQKTAQLAVTVSTVASGRIESAIGNLSPPADKRCSRMRHPIHPNASPNKPPGTATARLRAEHQEHRRYCHSQYFRAQPAILNEFSVRKNRAIRVSRIGRYLETWLGNLA